MPCDASEPAAMKIGLPVADAWWGGGSKVEPTCATVLRLSGDFVFFLGRYEIPDFFEF